nr:NSP1 [Bat RVJ-like rotavirus BtSY3]
MLSTLRTFRRGKDLNDIFDFVSPRDLWHGRFTYIPSDPLHIFENVDHTKNKLKFIQETKSAITGRTRHVKMPVKREEMDYIDWDSQKIFLMDCCSRKDEHFCGALHDIYTNDVDYTKSVFKRPQIQHRTTIFIPCGTRFVRFRHENEDKLIVASKTRKCMCGNLVMTSATVTGTPGFQYISFCSSDFLTATMSGHRPKKCISCGKHTTAYEANPSTWKLASGDEFYPRGNLCCYCCPVRHIFATLVRNGYEPEVDEQTYAIRRQKWWKDEKFGISPTFWTFRASNHKYIFDKLVGFGSYSSDDKPVIRRQNNSWIRDLTAEGVESNPGPNYISSLYELSQKFKLPPPQFTFTETKSENNTIFLCTCTFNFKMIQGAGYTKQAAKNAACMNMLAIM